MYGDSKRNVEYRGETIKYVTTFNGHVYDVGGREFDTLRNAKIYVDSIVRVEKEIKGYLKKLR